MVAKAKVRIEGEDATGAAWNSALGRGRAAASQMAGVFRTAFAGVALSSIANFGREAIKLGDDLQKASIKAGIGGKAMSELAYAAKLADVDLSSLSTALKKMQVSLSQANSGGKEQVKTLNALGLSIAEIINLAPDKQFELLAQRISQLKDPADKARAATELFGKAGADLLPLFEQGAAGIQKAREEAERLGLSFGPDQLKKLADADDAIKKLDASWQGFAATLTAEVAPTLTKILNDLSGVGGQKGRRATAFGVGNMLLGAPLAFYNAYGSDAFDAKPKPGSGGRRGGDVHSVVPMGYAAEAAEEEAKKERAARETEEVKWAARHFDMVSDMNAQVDALADASLKEDMERAAKRLDLADEWYETWMENEKKLEEFREEQSHKLSESAQVFKDVFTQAFDDMLNTGKINWNNLLKYMLARFAQMQFDKMLNSIFSGSNGGFWSQLLGAFSGNSNSAVGGIVAGMVPARAGGGPVSAGSTYLVGERGAEAFRPNTSGSIIPNGGGASNVNISYNVDARGATTDLIAALPGILKRAGEANKADIIGGIRSGRYPIGAARG